MSRPNRVTPAGDLVAVPDRGLFWGNRGVLLDRHGRMARHSRGRAWAICELEFKNRRRTQWVPGSLTELYFLDEATGLAAGHRPCGECRRPAYREFKRLWAAVHPDQRASAPAIDDDLHEHRLREPGVHRTFRANVAALPDGSIVRDDRLLWLVHGSELLAWTPAGYTERRNRPGGGLVEVLTPRPTVDVLDHGYRAVVHGSA